MAIDPETDRTLREVYAQARTIAVVGASTDPSKPAHQIPRYLRSQGYRIVPVNPKEPQVLEEQSRRSLSEIGEPVDVVDVFRPPREAERIAREAVEIGAKVLWFQPGTSTEEAVRAGEEGGLLVIADVCMGTMHGRLGLGPGPWH